MRQGGGDEDDGCRETWSAVGGADIPLLATNSDDHILLPIGGGPLGLLCCATADWTPLHLAATKPSLEAVRLLLEGGADAYRQNRDGRHDASILALHAVVLLSTGNRASAYSLSMLI